MKRIFRRWQARNIDPSVVALYDRMVDNRYAQQLARGLAARSAWGKWKYRLAQSGRGARLQALALAITVAGSGLSLIKDIILPALLPFLARGGCDLVGWCTEARLSWAGAVFGLLVVFLFYLVAYEALLLARTGDNEF